MLRVAAAALLLTVVLAPAVGAEWSSFRGDSRNSATVPSSTYALYEDVWWNNKTLGGAQLQASPVLKDSLLIVADKGAPGAKCPVEGAPASTKAPTGAPIGLVRALDAESGRQVWCTAMTAPVYSTPAISGDHVYVADMKGVLRALNLEDGRVDFEDKSIGSAGTQAPIQIRENKVFVGTESGAVRAFEASTLKPLWTFDITDYSPIYTDPVNKTCGAKFGNFPIRSGAAAYGGSVFFGAMNNWFFAVKDAGTGIGDPTQTGATLLWAYQTGDIIVGAPTVTLSTDPTPVARVVIGSYDGTVYAFNPAQALTPPASTPSKAPCAWTGAQASPTPDNNVVQRLWRFAVPTIDGTTQASRVHSSPAGYDNKVFFGANNGHVYAVRANDGVLVWENKTTGNVIEPVTSSPIVANGIIMVGSQNKNVYWIDASTGRVLKTFPAQSAVETSGAIDGSRAFIAATDGTVYMFGPKIPTRPDLVVQSIAATADGVKVTVKNQGDAASNATTVRLLKGGTFLANVDVEGIPAGETKSVTYDLEFEGAALVIKAIVDPDAAIAESVESNNELQKSVSEPVAATTDQEKDGGGGGGFKIPAPGLAPLLAVLGLAVLAMRRRK